ncbi:MAG: hypothetical protein Q9226_005120 [Calogaya cf. arnoldii]
MANIGLAPNGGPRDGVSLGGYTNPITITRGKSQRSFTGNSYWKPFTSRPNLHTVTGAVVSNIIFVSNRIGELVATGLNFTANNQSFIANASREVILSGGAMKSPQMLELKNLQDYLQCGVLFVAAAGEFTFDDAYENNEFWTRVYQENGTGLLADQQDRPQEVVAKYYNGSSEGLRPGVKLQLDLTAKKLVDPNQQAVQTGASAGGSRPVPGQENTGAYISGLVTHAFSRGYVHIQSADPNNNPKFDPRYLSHPLDYEFFETRAAATPPLSNHLKGNGTVLTPLFTVINETNIQDLFNAFFITG